MKKCLILLVHGSKKTAWKEPFEKLVQSLREKFGVEKIHLACMELCAPTLMGAARDAIDLGYHHIQVLPLFMAMGSHLKRDIPAQIEEVCVYFPEVKVDLLPHIGSHPLFWKTLEEIGEGYLETGREE